MIDFSSNDAVRALNRALFAVEFGIDLILPDGKLCPTVRAPRWPASLPSAPL